MASFRPGKAQTVSFRVKCILPSSFSFFHFRRLAYGIASDWFEALTPYSATVGLRVTTIPKLIGAIITVANEEILALYAYLKF